MDISLEMIDKIRRDSRQLVREFGLLGADYDVYGLTLAERHLLIELESQVFPDVGGIAELLLIDKSTASRLVAGLVKKGYIEYSQDKQDKRRRCIQLTEAARKKLTTVKEIAQTQVRESLETLSKEEVDSVVKGIANFSKGLERARKRREYVVEKISANDSVSIAKLIVEILSEYDCNRDGYAAQDKELYSMYETYNQPRHAYFVVKKDGIIAGGGGIAPLKGEKKEVCELQKMYLAKNCRGLGLGSVVLENCLQEAMKMGYKICYLETDKSMLAAHRFYETHGFKRIPKRRGETGHFACDCYYELKL